MFMSLLAIGTIQAAKKVHTIGDSTMANYEEDKTITRGWGMYFGNFLTNGWESINYARGGRDARQGYNELWQTAKNNVAAGDYVIIQFAHNDEMFNGVDHDELDTYLKGKGETFTIDSRGTNPATTYKSFLKKIAEEVTAKGATPILVAPVCRFWFDNKNQIRRDGRHDLGGAYSTIGDSYTYDAKKGLTLSKSHSLPESDHTMDYAYQMKQLADAEGIAFIDLTTASKELFEEYGPTRCAAELQSIKIENNVEKVDGTHFREAGALLIARLCAQKMQEAGILAENINVPSDLSVTPETLDMGDSYIGMTLTKEMILSGFGLTPSDGTVTITADGDVELSLDKTSWKSELTVDYSNGTMMKTIFARMVLTSTGTVNATINATNGTKNVSIPVIAKGIELSTGAPVSLNWLMATNGDATKDGAIEVVAQQWKNMELVDYSKNAQRSQVTGGAWGAAEDDDPNRYISFGLKSTSDKTIKIDKISMKVGGAGSSDLNCHVYYTTDGFQTRKTLLEKNGMADGTMYDIDATTNISLEKNQILEVRIYPWATAAGTGKYLCLQDVIISGVEEGAALNDESATITYQFDEGKEGQTGTYGPKAQATTWFKSNYVETGSNLNYQLKSNVGSTSTTAFQPTAKSNSAGGDIDNIDFIFIPKKGLLFTPTKVTFKVCRYGTNGGNMVYSWVDGEGNVTKIGEKVGGKELFAQNTIQEFSFDVTGVNATSGTQKFRINLYSLDNTKQVGFRDIIIEGKLKGIPQNVTQYKLTTSVNNDGAGTITVTPAGIMFDEGDEVTVTANKNFGYKFIGWQDASGATISTDAETQVTMNDNKTMRAVFEAVPIYTVKTEVVTDNDDLTLGSITLSPNDHEDKYEAGSKITATANTSDILKFTKWEDNSTTAERQITVDKDMTITANFEVQDFIAVFDASKTESYAYSNTAGYPFAADIVWDTDRNAKASIVKVSDGSLAYTQNGGTPVVRNRKSVVIPQINGLYQNGYHTADIAWQYEFSTKGFSSANFKADMCAKNAATKQYKALISVDGGDFTELKAPWDVTDNIVNSVIIGLPASAIGKEKVVIRITGTGSELYNTSYAFDKTFNGLRYCDHSESGVGNVYILGEAEAIDDKTAPSIIATIPTNNATDVSAMGKITVTFDEKIEAGPANGVATLNGQPINADWSSKSVSFSYSNLDYNTEYTFKMPAGFVQDKSGNAYNEAVNIVFTTMNRPTVEKAVYDVIVSTTEELSAAIETANKRADKSKRFRIFIKKGVYKMPTGAMKHYKHTNSDKTITYWEGDLKDPITYVKAANISFIGEDRESTIITQDISNDADMLFDGQFGKAHKYEEIANSAVLQLESTATGTYFQDITIKSGINDNLGRNLAVHDMSSKTIYKNTLLYGYQDTWTSNNGQGLYYFEGGQVRGRTDYLCGKGDAYFNGVELLQIASGYAAVPSTPKSIGWVFKDCQISADGSGVDGTYTLGRPWGKGTPVAVFIDTKMNVIPKAEGWNEMSDGWPKRFAEYNSVDSKGKPIDLRARKTNFASTHTNNPTLTEEEATAYSDMTKMFGDWQPTLLTEQAPIPTDVKLNGEVLSWTGSDYALLYAICEDGEIIGFTTDTHFDLSTIAAKSRRAQSANKYTVRAANEMGGMSAASVPAVATGIKSVNLQNDVHSQEIYTIDGRRVSTIKKGVYIIRQQMADGSTRTQKVIR